MRAIFVLAISRALILSVLILPVFINAQSSYEEEFQKNYEINITKERINDIYIPIDIDDAMIELDRLSTAEGRNKMIEASEEVIKSRLIYGLGKWMILNWNFYEGSRLSHVLKQKGISYPHDMASFLLVTYYRHLKGLPLEIEGRAKVIHKKRKAAHMADNARRITVKG